MKPEEQLSLDIKEDVVKKIKEDTTKGWFWRKLGNIFLDTLLPIIWRVILEKYHITLKDEQ